MEISSPTNTYGKRIIHGLKSKLSEGESTPIQIYNKVPYLLVER